MAGAVYDDGLVTMFASLGLVSGWTSVSIIAPTRYATLDDAMKGAASAATALRRAPTIETDSVDVRVERPSSTGPWMLRVDCKVYMAEGSTPADASRMVESLLPAPYKGPISAQLPPMTMTPVTMSPRTEKATGILGPLVVIGVPLVIGAIMLGGGRKSKPVSGLGFRGIGDVWRRQSTTKKIVFGTAAGLAGFALASYAFPNTVPKAVVDIPILFPIAQSAAILRVGIPRF